MEYDFENIPAELKEYRQWVCWRYAERYGRRTKLPFTPSTGRNAKSNDPATWETYEDAVSRVDKYDGIGFVISKDDPFVLIDIDHLCEEGEPLSSFADFAEGDKGDMAVAVCCMANSYTEVSPSGTGLHIIARAKKPADAGSRNDKLGLEIYDHKRFATMTGRLFKEDGEFEAIRDAQEDVSEICGHYLAKKPKRAVSAATMPYTGTLDPDTVIEKIRASKSAEKFEDLFAWGYIEGKSDYQSHSNADIALCNILAFWCNSDPALMDAIFRRSQLIRPKWDEIHGDRTYGQMTIDNALAHVEKRFDWSRYLSPFCGHPYGWDDAVTVYDDREDNERAVMEQDAAEEERRVWSTADYLDCGLSDDIEEFSSREVPSTGLKSLDRQCDGLYPGLYVLGAISSLGKTTLALQIADHIAASGTDVIFFSLEQSRFELVSKLLARRTYNPAGKGQDIGFSALEIRKGTANRPKLDAAIENLNETAAPRLFIEECNFNVSIVAMRQQVEKHISSTGNKPVVFVDYLQIIPAIDPHMTDKQSIDMTVRALKIMQVELGVTVVVVSSFNRANYMTPVAFESFKESGGIEYTADVVWGLQLSCLDEDLFNSDAKTKIAAKRERINEAKAENPRKVDLKCLKNRYGRSIYSCSFKYLPRFDRFEDL